MCPRLATVVFALVLAGCGTGGSEEGERAASTERNFGATAHVDKCVELLLSRSAGAGNEQDVRVYVENTYCVPFERNGWIYDDGALRIAAQEWLDNGGAEECGTASSAGEPSETALCGTDTEPLDCALLHHVRRAEVTAYLAELQREGSVQCDDGTPLAELGVP